MVLPLTRRRRLARTISVFLAVCALLTAIFLTTTTKHGATPAGGQREGSPGPAAAPADSPSAGAPSAGPSSPASTSTASSSDSKTAHPRVTDPSNPLVLVNRQRPISPRDFVPQNLQGVGNGQLLAAPAAQAYGRLEAAAAAAGVPLRPVSGYRSFDYQRSLYASYASVYGQAFADAFSAPPGTSEHQTGLAIDVVGTDGACELQECFGETAAGIWVREQSWRHGFIVRYPKGLRQTTGYEYEPWHLRYVGREAAAAMRRLGLKTFEEYTALRERT